jgi:hypothetical protein
VGGYYLWTSKLGGKTICLTLSKEQYDALAQTLKNNRKTQKILQRMQAIRSKPFWPKCRESKTQVVVKYCEAPYLRAIQLQLGVNERANF